MFLNGGTDHTLSLRLAVFDGFLFYRLNSFSKRAPASIMKNNTFLHCIYCIRFLFFFLSSQSVNIFFRGPQLSCVHHRDSSAQQKEVEKYVIDDLESAYTHTSYTYIHTLTIHPTASQT